MQTSRPLPGEVLGGVVGGRLAVGARRSPDLAAFGALGVVVAAEVTTSPWLFVPCLRLCGGVVGSGLIVEFLGVVLEQVLLACASGSPGRPWWRGVELQWRRACFWWF